MRKIKFRGMSLDGWVYGCYVVIPDGIGGLEDCIWQLGADNAVPVSSKIINQYTGLKDKNGTEIYEGDILLIQANGYDPIISEVVWGGTEYPAFDLPNYDGYGMNAFSAIYHNDIEETLEVIGNIYENPELLERE